MIKAVINLEAPRNQVFAVLTDFPNYKAWIPGCELCEVLSRSAASTDTRIVIRSMKRMEMALRFDAEPVQALKFRMVKGKDLKAYAGTYRLMDSADGRGTVVIAELDIDAGFMVPKFMVDKMAGKALEDTGAALKKYVLTAPLAAALAPARKAPAAEAKPRRARQMVRIVKTAAGYSVWIQGQTFVVKSSAV